MDLTCVPVSGRDLIGWETSHHHHIGCAEVRSGRTVGYGEHIGRQARGTFVALCMFKVETVQGVPRARGNRMCPVTMACAKHGVVGGMGASTKGMDCTIARGRRAEHTREMVGDAIKAHAEEVNGVINEEVPGRHAARDQKAIAKANLRHRKKTEVVILLIPPCSAFVPSVPYVLLAL